MENTEDIVELPLIPADAPDWVRSLPQSGRFVDRSKLYDITGHLLFDSLLNSNGIRHFFYFMDNDQQAEQARQRFNGKCMNQTNNNNTNDDDRIDVRVAFHLGEGICGHRGIV
jgi:hypothetical protein